MLNRETGLCRLCKLPFFCLSVFLCSGIHRGSKMKWVWLLLIHVIIYENILMKGEGSFEREENVGFGDGRVMCLFVCGFM